MIPATFHNNPRLVSSSLEGQIAWLWYKPCYEARGCIYKVYSHNIYVYIIYHISYISIYNIDRIYYVPARMASDLNKAHAAYEVEYQKLLEKQGCFVENPSKYLALHLAGPPLSTKQLGKPRSSKEQLAQMFVACQKADVAMNNLLSRARPGFSKLVQASLGPSKTCFWNVCPGE